MGLVYVCAFAWYCVNVGAIIQWKLARVQFCVLIEFYVNKLVHIGIFRGFIGLVVLLIY